MPLCGTGMEGRLQYLYLDIAWHVERNIKIEIPRSGGSPLYGARAAGIIFPFSRAFPSKTVVFSAREY